MLLHTSRCVLTLLMCCLQMSSGKPPSGRLSSQSKSSLSSLSSKASCSSFRFPKGISRASMRSSSSLKSVSSVLADIPEYTPKGRHLKSCFGGPSFRPAQASLDLGLESSPSRRGTPASDSSSKAREEREEADRYFKAMRVKSMRWLKAHPYYHAQYPQYAKALQEIDAAESLCSASPVVDDRLTGFTTTPELSRVTSAGSQSGRNSSRSGRLSGLSDTLSRKYSSCSELNELSDIETLRIQSAGSIVSRTSSAEVMPQRTRSAESAISRTGSGSSVASRTRSGGSVSSIISETGAEIVSILSPRT